MYSSENGKNTTINLNTKAGRKFLNKAASWLSPEYESFVYDIIDEYQQKGFAVDSNATVEQLAKADLKIEELKSKNKKLTSSRKTYMLKANRLEEIVDISKLTISNEEEMNSAFIALMSKCRKSYYSEYAIKVGRQIKVFDAYRKFNQYPDAPSDLRCY